MRTSRFVRRHLVVVEAADRSARDAVLRKRAKDFVAHAHFEYLRSLEFPTVFVNVDESPLRLGPRQVVTHILKGPEQFDESTIGKLLNIFLG